MATSLRSLNWWSKVFALVSHHYITGIPRVSFPYMLCLGVSRELFSDTRISPATTDIRGSWRSGAGEHRHPVDGLDDELGGAREVETHVTAALTAEGGAVRESQA